MICQRCGHDNSSSRRSCKQCRADLVEQWAQTVQMHVSGRVADQPPTWPHLSPPAPQRGGHTGTIRRGCAGCATVGVLLVGAVVFLSVIGSATHLGSTGAGPPITTSTPLATLTSTAVSQATATRSALATPTVVAIAAGVSTKPTEPQPDTTLAGQTRYIADTEGIGVKMRSSCDDQSGTTGWPEGTAVTIVYARSDCAEWLLVKRSSDQGSWVRTAYLSESPPVVAVLTEAPAATLPPPTSAPTATPATPTLPTVAKPAPVTPTPGPPTPTARPSGPSPEVRAYLDWLQPKTELASLSLKGIGEQSDQLRRDPRLIADSTWILKTGFAVATLDQTGKDMQAYPDDVPQEAKQLDDIVKDLGRDLVYIAAEYTAGIDGRDAARINNANARMNGIGPKTRQAAAQIQALNR
jgi:hypothetical protein